MIAEKKYVAHIKCPLKKEKLLFFLYKKYPKTYRCAYSDVNQLLNKFFPLKLFNLFV